MGDTSVTNMGEAHAALGFAGFGTNFLLSASLCRMDSSESGGCLGLRFRV